MASFLYPCTNGCGGQVRFTRAQTEPVICDNCVKAIAANEASAKASKRRVKRRTAKRRRSTKLRA